LRFPASCIAGEEESFSLTAHYLGPAEGLLCYVGLAVLEGPGRTVVAWEGYEPDVVPPGELSALRRLLYRCVEKEFRGRVRFTDPGVYTVRLEAGVVKTVAGREVLKPTSYKVLNVAVQKPGKPPERRASWIAFAAPPIIAGLGLVASSHML